MIANIEIIGKPRMTKADAWKKRPCVEKYWQVKDALVAAAEKQNFRLGNSLFILICLPFPKSYSKKKRLKLMAKAHQEKPDIDNLIKTVLDSLKKDDKTVYFVAGKKMWHEQAMVLIENQD